MSQSILPEQLVEEDDSPFPTPDGKYFWSKLWFASCDGIYRWFHYDQIHRNVFAQELAQGRWYIRDVETCEFEEFSWSKRAAEEIAEKNQTIAAQRLREKGAPVLYVKSKLNIIQSKTSTAILDLGEYPKSKLVSRAVPTKSAAVLQALKNHSHLVSPTFPKAFDSFKNMVYNFNGKGQQLIPRTPSGFPIYPSDSSRGPLFPVNVTTREPEFLYNEDGVLVLPVNVDGLVILPRDLYGQLKFPLDETGSLIWPIDDEGMPYPPVDTQGIPDVRYDENGLPILPYDNSGEQLIMFDQNGIPMKLSEFRQKFSEEQAKTWGGGKLPPHLVMPVVPTSVNKKSSSSSRAPDLPNPLPFLQTNAPSLELPEIPPEYNLAMAKLAARNLTGKFQLEYSIEIKHWEEEMEKRRQEMMKQNSEELEKYEKARREEEERKKRLGSFLRNSTKEPVVVDKKDIKKTVEQLRAEVQAKRDRLREEEGKKKSEAEKEVQKYYDEATKKEMEKQKNDLQASSPSSTDTYQGMNSPEQQPRSRKRRHENESDHAKSRNQRVYVAGERKKRNSSTSHLDEQRSELKNSVATEDKHTHKKRASSRSSERSEKSQNREKSRKRKKSKKSKKHKREKKRKRDKEFSKSPRDSSIERSESDLKDRKVHVEDTTEPLNTDKPQSEPVSLPENRCSSSAKEEPKKTVEEETIKDQPNDDFAKIPVEIQDEFDEEEEVRRRLLIKQQERIAARKAAEVVESEPFINTESPTVPVCPVQAQHRISPLPLPSSSSANLGSQESNHAKLFAQNDLHNETTLNTFKQLADGYLREMDGYLTEIRRERELFQHEWLKHKKMLVRARLLNEDDNSDDERHGRVGNRKVLLQNDQNNSDAMPSSSKIYINPAVLQRRNAERFGK